MAISHPQPKKLSDILTLKRYTVPLYQRPYAWEIGQVSEFWDDIVRNEPPYFIGILVLRTDNGKVFEVVDGQQRLATLLLLLRAVVNILSTEDPEEAQNIQKSYINQKRPLTNEEVPTLILNKRDKEKFESLILGTTPPAKKRYLSWRNLESTLTYFIDKLNEMKKEKGLDGVKSFILNRVLSLELLDVQVDKDSDVYLFFETLNDRGMDLSLADLVKNRVCAMAAKLSFAPDDAANKIDDISELLGSGKVKGFLLHYCWSKSTDKEPPPRKRLMDWYNETIEKEKSKFLNSLEDGALRYTELINPREISDQHKKKLLTYLNVLNATRCFPLLLQGSESLSRKDFIRLCNAVEILTFRHSTISKRDAKVLESIYYNLAKELKKRVKIDKILEVLKENAAKVPGDLFKVAFTEYEPENHKIARYILLKIEEKKAKQSVPLDWDQMTLEHILPQSGKWEGKSEYLDHLGNLTLLSAPLNGDVADKDFKTKKQEYKKEKRIIITKELLKYSKFTKEEIVLRQKEFSEIATKIWNPQVIG